MLAFLTMERPERANLRPCRWAMVIACWMRWMCEAKLATITRPSASAKIRWKALLTVLSEAVDPGASALVESPSNARTPFSPSRAKASTSVTRPSIGVWSKR